MNLLTKARDDPVYALILVVGIPFALWYLIGSPGAGGRLGFSLALVWFGFGASLMIFRRTRT